MIVITLGDPYSVTVEILVRHFDQIQTLHEKALGLPHAQSGRGVVFVGSLSHWVEQSSGLCVQAPFTAKSGKKHLFKVIHGIDELMTLDPSLGPSQDHMVFWDIGGSLDHRDPFVPAPHLPLIARGQIASRTLEALQVDLFTKWPYTEERLAVVTGPVDKFALDQVGFPFPGQTEFFESLWNQQAVMTLAGPKLRVGLVTNHHGLREVPDLITPEKVVHKIQLFAKTLQGLMGISHPKIGVCGLNPHCGDQGKFGNEEITTIAPAIKTAQKLLRDVTVVGPLPADTAFYRGYHGVFDGILAMYHDQGLGPLKLVHFDEAINISGGLPHLRVSPDHGPAQDLYLKGQASAASFIAALDLGWTYLQSQTLERK